jgi:hypothetical protein
MNPKCSDCCYPEFINSKFCGCCEGIEVLTPLSTANRPGLSQLAYRIGTHGSFLETMKARLSSTDFPELRALTIRQSHDPSIALLDAWATVADVLTFYQERIANEGYLRTAVERRSILELARLVGYKLRPGVASSVFLAYTIDENTKEEVTIPAGSRAQSVPGPDELPQPFETSEALKARAKWNNLKPRMTRPQTATSINNDPESSVEQAVQGPRIYLKGISTNLKPNDPLLIDFGESSPFNSSNSVFFRVKEVSADAAADRTLVTLRRVTTATTTAAEPGAETKEEKLKTEKKLNWIEALTLPPSIQPANSLRLERKLKEQFKPNAEAGYAAVSTFAPVLRETLATAAANAEVTSESKIKVYALRAKAGLFGHNYPGVPVSLSSGAGPDSGSNAFLTLHVPIPLARLWPSELLKEIGEGLKEIALEPQNEQLQAQSKIVIEYPTLELDGCSVTGRKHSIHEVQEVKQITMSGQITMFGQQDVNLSAVIPRQGGNLSAGFTSKVNLVTLDENWLAKEAESNENNIEGLLNCIPLLRETTVYVQSEELELAEEPIDGPVGGCSNDSNSLDDFIELDGFYEGLESGRWVIVSGERDIAGTSGVRLSELAMLAAVKQDIQKVKVAGLKDSNNSNTEDNDSEKDLAGDKLHTFIKLAEKLQYCFKRDTVRIYGNVVKATHGETRREVLGSGDGSKALQSFDLKQSPLTFVSASNPSGVDSTLKVLVNDLRWHEADSLAGLQTNDHRFITKTTDEQKTTVIFGNGKQGARPPTGIENIQAEYRSGIGKPGNVRAEQISLLTTKPLGVKEVINPLRASGGADRENRDQARKNAPLAVKALDRLVSVQDYEDFARTYAGIGKAKAVELTDGRRQLVHVTIAGADDIPIDGNSDLFQNLYQALHDFGDPFQPIELAVRELMLIVISANVRIQPDYQWEPVVTGVRAALLDAFSFERRKLGQDALLSEVISVMQKVRGVAYVDVDTFGGIPEKIKENDERRLLTPDEIAEAVECLSMESPGDTGDKCNKYGNAENREGVRQRLRVNLAELENGENGAIRPAQLAFLSPEVPATLILNRIE